jgi:hypothetical protein
MIGLDVRRGGFAGERAHPERERERVRGNRPAMLLWLSTRDPSPAATTGAEPPVLTGPPAPHGLLP